MSFPGAVFASSGFLNTSPNDEGRFIQFISFSCQSAFLRLSNYGDGGHNGLILDIN